MQQKLVTAKQIQKIDEKAIKKYGIPSIALMENAGKAVADHVVKSLLRSKLKRVVIVCGVGNNAGDGFVAARHLISRNINVNVLVVGNITQLKHDALINYKVLKKLRIAIKHCKQVTQTEVDVIKDAIIVDALFGVGLNREIKEPYYSFVKVINRYAKKCLSVDISSGLDATTGKIYGCAVNADSTITFTLAKKGMYLKEGPKNSGKIIIENIGIPLERIT